ncbi:MAG: EamA family transporter [Candidatus Aenigmarchaeota archaeon]|nr:EamA family transporter [Candidatus Aenigmarchaeota archaeon]
MEQAAFFGIVFGLVAMAAYGLSSFLTPVAVRKYGLVRPIFYRECFAAIFMLAFILATSQWAPITADVLLLTLAISLLGFFPVITLFKALSIGKLGINVPIANSSVLYTVLLSAIFYREAISLQQAIAIALVVVGVVFISFRPGQLKAANLRHTAAGATYAFATSLIWGLVFFLWKIPVNIIGPVMTAFILESGMVLWSAGWLRFQVGMRIRRKDLLFLAGFGLLVALGTMSYNIGISLAGVSVVAPLTFSYALLVAVLARLFNNERLTRLQYLSMVFIVCGIILLTAGQ